jgi:hypothetical protein
VATAGDDIVVGAGMTGSEPAGSSNVITILLLDVSSTGGETGTVPFCMVAINGNAAAIG